jgi:hypothetical protein
MRGHFIARYDRFIKPIISKLTDESFICSLASEFSEQTIPPMTEFIWVDFATEDAIGVQNFVTPALKILRIHAYEAYTDIIKAIHPRAWHRIIFVNQYLANRCQQIWGENYDNVVVIPNHIDLEANHLPPDPPAEKNKVAYAGYFSRKKGINEMYLLARQLPEYEFHLAGTPQEEDLWEFMENTQPGNVFLYPWQDDLPAFFADKTYFINTSVRESGCVSMIEAACCGLKPLVYCWAGAEGVYPDEYIWWDVERLKILLDHPGDPSEHRERVIAHLQLDQVMPRIVDLLLSPPADLPMPSVTVGIVQTRNKYLPELFHSLDLQGYDIEIDLLDNRAREKTVGQCYNELADRCTTDFILYVGDDDYLSEDYVYQIISAYVKRQFIQPGIVAVVTGGTMFDETGKASVTLSIPTGLWKADFVRAARFDEKLVRQVDTEFFQRFGRDYPNNCLLRLPWVYGYFYRQHSNNLSGNKFQGPANTSQEPVK